MIFICLLSSVYFVFCFPLQSHGIYCLMLFNKKSKKNKRKFHVIDKGKRYQYSYQRDVYKNLISHFVKLQHLLCIFTASFFFLLHTCNTIYGFLFQSTNSFYYYPTGHRQVISACELANFIRFKLYNISPVVNVYI